MRNGDALDCLFIDGVKPDHVDSSIRANFDCRPLPTTSGIIVVVGTDGKRIAPGRATIGRAGKDNLVAPISELRPGGVDVVAERAVGIGISRDRILIVKDGG